MRRLLLYLVLFIVLDGEHCQIVALLGIAHKQVYGFVHPFDDRPRHPLRLAPLQANVRSLSGLPMSSFELTIDK